MNGAPDHDLTLVQVLEFHQLDSVLKVTKESILNFESENASWDTLFYTIDTIRKLHKMTPPLDAAFMYITIY